MVKSSIVFHLQSIGPLVQDLKATFDDHIRVKLNFTDSNSREIIIPTIHFLIDQNSVFTSLFSESVKLN